MQDRILCLSFGALLEVFITDTVYRKKLPVGELSAALHFTFCLLPRERLDSKPLLDSFKHSFIYFFSLFTKKCFAENHVHSFMSAKCARRLRCRVERHHGARAND